LESQLDALPEDDINEFSETKLKLFDGFYNGPLPKDNESVQKYTDPESLN
jgi:hypothetical protein